MRRGLLFCMVMIGIVASSGCISVQQLKYGKLHSMQLALEGADNNCSDDKARHHAVVWALHGIRDLQSHHLLLEKESPEYLAARRLIGQLSMITSRRIHNDERLCQRIASAREATDSYLQEYEQLALVSREAR